MITASHNPPEDNGVKLVDPMGEMLENSWEAYSTELANAKNEDVVKIYRKLEKELKINSETPARAVFARDTRPSGPGLVKALVDALTATGTEYTDYKLLTTPQLHYLTRCTNTEGTPQSYGEVSEKGYYEKLSKAFVRAMKGKKPVGSVTVDCANGVGGPKLAELLKYLPSAADGGLDIKIINDDVVKAEVLNFDVSSLVVCTPYKTDNFSVVPIMSKPSNVLLHHRRLGPMIVVAPWMAMLIVLFTILLTPNMVSVFSMAIRSPPWPHPSLAI